MGKLSPAGKVTEFQGGQVGWVVPIHGRGDDRALGFPVCRENLAVPKWEGWQVTT